MEKERHTYYIACRAGKENREGKGRNGKGGRSVSPCFLSLLALCFLVFLGFHQFVRVGFPIDSQIVRVFVSALNRTTYVKDKRGMRVMWDGTTIADDRAH